MTEEQEDTRLTAEEKEDRFKQYRDSKGKFLKGNPGGDCRANVRKLARAFDDALTEEQQHNLFMGLYKIAMKSRSEQRRIEATLALQNRLYGRVREYKHVEVDQNTVATIDPTKLSASELRQAVELVEKMEIRKTANLTEGNAY